MKNMIQRSSITRSLRGAIALVGLGMALTGPAVASAATAPPLSEFSPYVAHSVYTIPGNGCTVGYGPLWDGAGAWAVVGGMSVSCPKNQSTMTAEVQEWYSATGKAGTWYQTGQYGYASGTNINGWSGFIHGSGVCGSGYWSTEFWLYTPSTGWVTLTSVVTGPQGTPAGCVNGSPAAN